MCKRYELPLFCREPQFISCQQRPMVLAFRAHSKGESTDNRSGSSIHLFLQSQCTPYGAALCMATVEEPQNRRCFCHEYARFNNATQLCEMKQNIGEYCQQAATCKVANTICTASNTCECKPNFVAQNDEECKPAFGAECEATEDCAFENAECKVEVVNEKETKTCKCKEEFVDVGNKCLEKGELLRKALKSSAVLCFSLLAKNYNDTCTESEQCRPLLGDKGACNDNQCNCDESLHYKKEKCQDKKGWLCPAEAFNDL